MGKLGATSTDCPALMGDPEGGLGGLVGISQRMLAIVMS